MSILFRSIIAVIAGILIGSLVNMGIISLGGTIIPPPPGTNLSTTAGLADAMRLFEPQHFIFPFLAHALGTFAGATIAAIIAVQYRKQFALGIGAYFLMGGIIMIAMLPSPLWYTLTDLIFAYFPMAYLAYLFVIKQRYFKISPTIQ